MKKKLLTLVFCLIFSLVSFAQVNWYRTTSFAYKQKASYGWTNWSNWEKSNLQVSIDLDNDIIKIYSNKIQTYIVTEARDAYRDSSDGVTVEFGVIDQDYDRGTVRLRVERNGNSQIYVDFANIMWVYNVIRIR